MFSTPALCNPHFQPGPRVLARDNGSLRLGAASPGSSGRSGASRGQQTGRQPRGHWGQSWRPDYGPAMQYNIHCIKMIFILIWFGNMTDVQNEHSQNRSLLYCRKITISNASILAIPVCSPRWAWRGSSGTCLCCHTSSPRQQSQSPGPWHDQIVTLLLN